MSAERPAFLREERFGGGGSAGATVVAPRPPAAARLARDERVPGEAGLWVFLLGDMSIFALLFAVYLVADRGEKAAFARAREQLTLGFGVASTVLLLTSSLLVALAVHAHHAGERRTTLRLVALAAACGVAFAALKGIEWTRQIDAGHTPASSDFFTYYFVLTGVHLVHLLVGLVGLGALGATAARGPADDVARRRIECAAAYWHMVDLLWLVIFPLFYLVAG